MIIKTYLEALWLTSKEQDIFVTTLQYWETNASKVAQHLGRERTSTYKMMQHLVQQGFLTTKKKSGTTVFSPINLHAIKKRFEIHQKTLTSLYDKQDDLDRERSALSSTYHHDTSIQIFEWLWWLQQVYQTILNTIDKEKLIHISCFASATFESQTFQDTSLTSKYQDFLSWLTKRRVTTQSYLGMGLALMEQLLVTTNIQDTTALPTRHESIQLRLIGDHIFIMLFKRSPQIIHIHNTQLAALMHFIGSQLQLLKAP